MTAVAAPAGFGKSTLLALWARSCRDRPVAWLSLDEHDDDPARLLAHARESIARAHPALRAAARRVATARARRRSPRWSTPSSGAATPLLLLVDDCHAVHSRHSRAALSFLARQLPASTQVVFAGREVPALGSARLRARGELTELRTDDLRFTAVEADRLLREQFAVALAPADLERLVDDTEGWPAGLYLAGLSMQGHADPPAFVREFTGDHRHVGDFLLEEVLRRETPAVRDFLLHSSILERLSGPLCDAALERTGSATVLADLERRNQFVIPLDERREWFRYHHLFAEFLRGELALAEPELVPVLHGRAAAWLRAHDELDLAVRHAAAAGAYDEAAAMIVANGPVWAQHGRPATVGAWLDLIPASVLEGDPQLAACAAWHARATGGDPTTLRDRIRLAERPDARPWIGVAATQRAELLLLRAVHPTATPARACARRGGLARDSAQRPGDRARDLAARRRAAPDRPPRRGARARCARRCAGRRGRSRRSCTTARWPCSPRPEAHAGDPQRGAHLAERAAQLIVEHDLGTVGVHRLRVHGHRRRLRDRRATSAGDPAGAARGGAARHAGAARDPRLRPAGARPGAVANGDDGAALATLERLRDAIAGAGDVRYVARAAAALARHAERPAARRRPSR